MSQITSVSLLIGKEVSSSPQIMDIPKETQSLLLPNTIQAEKRQSLLRLGLGGKERGLELNSWGKTP